MENTRELDLKRLISELMQGKDFVDQLRVHLDPSSSTGGLLVEKLLSSLNRAISILNSTGSEAEIQPTTGLIAGMSDSPRSISGSPRSDDSYRRDMYKKRKTLPRWTEQVRVCSGTGLEGPLDDGFSWRKYGQKDILGAKYPRGYYRCTHRNVQGCLATKQVQRSEDDPSVFEVTYRGKHTCMLASHPTATLPAPDEKHKQAQQKQKQSQEILFNFRTGLKVKTENFDVRELPKPSSFSFPSTPIECTKAENEIFPSLSLDNNLIDSFSSPFISPATSESNYFSPCRMSSFGGATNLQTLDSEFTEIISAATSSSNSPTLDLDFTLDPVEFDPNFPFDSLGLFN